MSEPLTATQLACGYNHVCALISGKVKCWGFNGQGQLGIGNYEPRGGNGTALGDQLPFVNFGIDAKVVELVSSAYADHTCALFENGDVKCWGSNTYGQLGISTAVKNIPDPGASDVLLSNAKQLITSTSAVCALNDAGEIFCWGAPTNTGTCKPYQGSPIRHENVEQVPVGFTSKRLFGCSGSFCAESTNGQKRCWGGTTCMANGDLRPVYAVGSEIEYYNGVQNVNDCLQIKDAPQLDIGSGSVSQYSNSGDTHACAVFTSGYVKCWGDNIHGGLGLGDELDRGGTGNSIGSGLPYVNLGSGVSILKVSAGRFFSCALYSDGKLKCWGFNLYGQLGLGRNESSIGSKSGDMGDNLPFVDLGSHKAVDMCTGGLTTCAIVENGRVACWGYGHATGRGNETIKWGHSPDHMGENIQFVHLGFETPVPSASPTPQPTQSPTTPIPTNSPVTQFPTQSPTPAPTKFTESSLFSGVLASSLVLFAGCMVFLVALRHWKYREKYNYDRNHTTTGKGRLGKLIVIHLEDPENPRTDGHGGTYNAHNNKVFLRACRDGSVKAIREGLKLKVNPGTANTSGVTALMMAAQSGKSKAVQILLEAGANINSSDKNGKTAFMYALQSGSDEVGMLFLNTPNLFLEAVDKQKKEAITYGDPRSTPLTYKALQMLCSPVTKFLRQHELIEHVQDFGNAGIYKLEDLEAIVKSDDPEDQLDRMNVSKENQGVIISRMKMPFYGFEAYIMGRPFKYHLFLSHDWAGGNHERVKKINQGLRKLKWSTWFDEEQVTGNVYEKMLQGIADSAVVLVFITRNYVDKIKEGNWVQPDNCEREFSYAISKKAKNYLIPVVMDKCLLDPSMQSWGIAAHGAFSNKMYVDFSDDERFGSSLSNLNQEIAAVFSHNEGDL